MDNVQIGVVGLGNIGSFHLNYLAAGKVNGATLAAVCDGNTSLAQSIGEKHNVRRFSRHEEMFASGAIDAVLIATPHFDHPPIATDAFAHGLHVLSEKPIAVSVGAARKLNEAAAQHPHLKFGVMFNQRARKIYQTLRGLIADGELGEVTRITWIITDWFRTWTYYASGGWRATWKDEGGGVLINQCPHNLDLLQWIIGMMPTRVTAVASIGKTHPIEVDDEVSAILEFPNGAIGHFVTSTGEAPGTNRLEIVGDRGKIIAENGSLTFHRTRKSVREIREKSPLPFAPVETWICNVPVENDSAEDHKNVTQNFVDAVRTGTPLLSPGVEGVRGLEIGNAMLWAGLTHQPVCLPLDADGFEAFLKELTAKYGGKKALVAVNAGANMAASFAK